MNVVHGTLLAIALTVLSSGISAQECKENEEFRTCGTNCLLSCDNLDSQICCSAQCTPGCFCKDGYILNEEKGNTQCVLIDDCPKPGAIEFVKRNRIVPEKAGKIRLKVTRVGGSKGQISAEWKAIGNSAIKSEDFLAGGGVIIMEDGQTDGFIEVTILDDTIKEINETFSVELFKPSAKTTIGDKGDILVTILDDDEQPGVFEISPIRTSVHEYEGTVTFNIIRLDGTDGRVTVSWATEDITAVVGVDYIVEDTSVIFEEGESSKSITIVIIDDGIWEQDEIFRIRIVSVSKGSIGVHFEATCVILDDDRKPGELEFEAINIIVAEKDGIVSLTVVRRGGSDGKVTVQYRTESFTALSGRDFIPTNGELVFGNGETRKNIFITIVDDLIFEQDEMFKVILSNPTGGATLGSNKVATVTIIDNDRNVGAFKFAMTSLSVPEDVGSATLTVLRIGGSDGQVVVKFTTEDITATKNVDYVPTSGELVFLNGETTKTIKVSIIDDTVFEPDETFKVLLLDASDGAIIMLAQSVAIVTIIDNDRAPGILEFQTTQVEVVENAFLVTLIVIRSQGSDGTVQIRYRTQNGSAKSGTDYVAAFGDLEFRDGILQKTIQIEIIDDKIREPQEEFFVQLFGPSGGAILGQNKLATVTIIDDDKKPGILEFRLTDVTVSESSFAVTLFVVRLDGSDGTVRVRYRTKDGTARAGMDYIQASGELEFPDGVIEQLILINIQDDFVKEPDETFFVQLFNPSEGAILGNKKLATVTILDNDVQAGVFNFEKISLTLLENSVASLTVLRTQGSDGEVSVKWKTNDRTATGGEDYTISSGLLIYGEGVTQQIIQIPILKDNIEEDTETFVVSLYDPQNGATIGPADRAVVNIIDVTEKPSVIQFTRRNRSVKESDGYVLAIVVRRISVQTEVSVNWKTVERSATENEDFVPSTGTLIFAPGEERKTINITIIDDQVEESNELFDVILFEPSRNALLGVPSRFTVEILDDDEAPGQFDFEETSVTVFEREQRVQLTILRTGGTGMATVRYRSRDGSAVAGIDYESAEKQVTFATDQTFEAIFIRIIDNKRIDPTRSFQVLLFDPSKGNVIGEGTAKIKILDDDFQTSRPSTPPNTTPSTTTQVLPEIGKVRFVFLSVFVKENEGSVQLYVARTTATVMVTVLWRPTDITAINNVHYKANKLNTLTFSPGESEKSITIEIIDNNMVNPTRRFQVELFTPFGKVTVDPTANVATVSILDDDVIVNPPATQRPITIAPSPYPSMPPMPYPVPVPSSTSPPPVIPPMTWPPMPMPDPMTMPPMPMTPMPMPPMPMPPMPMPDPMPPPFMPPVQTGCPPGMISSCNTGCQETCQKKTCPLITETLLGGLLLGGGGSKKSPTGCNLGCSCPQGFVLDSPGGSRCIPKSSCGLG